jgi:hypothetical protein
MAQLFFAAAQYMITRRNARLAPSARTFFAAGVSRRKINTINLLAEWSELNVKSALTHPSLNTDGALRLIKSI